MKKAEFEFIVRHIVEEIVSYLIEDTGVSLPDAFDKVYGTSLYKDLQNPRTHLYRYSPSYLYGRIQRENNGTLDY